MLGGRAAYLGGVRHCTTADSGTAIDSQGVAIHSGKVGPLAATRKRGRGAGGENTTPAPAGPFESRVLAEETPARATKGRTGQKGGQDKGPEGQALADVRNNIERGTGNNNIEHGAHRVPCGGKQMRCMPKGEMWMGARIREWPSWVTK